MAASPYGAMKRTGTGRTGSCSKAIVWPRNCRKTCRIRYHAAIGELLRLFTVSRRLALKHEAEYYTERREFPIFSSSRVAGRIFKDSRRSNINASCV